MGLRASSVLGPAALSRHPAASDRPTSARAPRRCPGSAMPASVGPRHHRGVRHGPSARLHPVPAADRRLRARQLAGLHHAGHGVAVLRHRRGADRHDHAGGAGHRVPGLHRLGHLDPGACADGRPAHDQGAAGPARPGRQGRGLALHRVAGPPGRGPAGPAALDRAAGQQPGREHRRAGRPHGPPRPARAGGLRTGAQRAAEPGGARRAGGPGGAARARLRADRRSPSAGRPAAPAPCLPGAPWAGGAGAARRPAAGRPRR